MTEEVSAPGLRGEVDVEYARAMVSRAFVRWRRAAYLSALCGVIAWCSFGLLSDRSATSAEGFPGVRAIEDILRRYPSNPRVIQLAGLQPLYVVEPRKAHAMLVQSRVWQAGDLATEFVGQAAARRLRPEEMVEVARGSPPTPSTVRSVAVKVDKEHRFLMVSLFPPELAWRLVGDAEAKAMADKLLWLKLERSVKEGSREDVWTYVMPLHNAAQADQARMALELTLFGKTAPLSLTQRLGLGALICLVLGCLFAVGLLFSVANCGVVAAEFLPPGFWRDIFNVRVLLFSPKADIESFLAALHTAQEVERLQRRREAEEEESAARERRLVARRDAMPSTGLVVTPAPEPTIDEVNARVAKLSVIAEGPDTGSAARELARGVARRDLENRVRDSARPHGFLD